MHSLRFASYTFQSVFPMMCFSLVFPQSDLQSQTPASPANTLDPSQGLQPPTELFAPFNPASVPSGRTLFIFCLNTPLLQEQGETNTAGEGERVERGDEGEPESQKIQRQRAEERRRTGG